LDSGDVEEHLAERDDFLVFHFGAFDFLLGRRLVLGGVIKPWAPESRPMLLLLLLLLLFVVDEVLVMVCNLVFEHFGRLRYVCALPWSSPTTILFFFPGTNEATDEVLLVLGAP
jgi:hypothetical protein